MPKVKTKNKNVVRIVLEVNESLARAIDFIIDNAGYINRPDVLRAGVRALMAKEFPKYVSRASRIYGDEGADDEGACINSSPRPIREHTSTPSSYLPTGKRSNCPINSDFQPA